MDNKTEAMFAPFRLKMQQAGLSPLLIQSFAHYYSQLVAGETGYIRGTAAQPVPELPDRAELGTLPAEGQNALERLVVIKLNGGLGTSMGLDAPKSLLVVKDDLRFFDVIVRHILRLRKKMGVRLPLVFMNSYNTQQATSQALAEYPKITSDLPPDFLQNKVPKIWQKSLAPAAWPEDPDKEWCPPGHGDIYLTLHTSRLLEQMLENGYEYAFVSNADNLGATVDLEILGFFASQQLPFLMEVTDRTPADRKGGHLAQDPDGRLLLREIAQCPPDEIEEFQDISRYRHFNTNNLWVHLPSLRQKLDEKDGRLDLPMIRNSKPVDPTQPDSPPVYQLETAMGLAISAFENAQAIRVPRSRFLPVKKCNDLLALRSDAYRLTPEQRVELDPRRGTDDFPAGPPAVELDPRYYQLIQQIEDRFPHGPPSLIRCRRFAVTGPFNFGDNLTATGDVALENPDDTPRHIPDGTTLSG